MAIVTIVKDPLDLSNRITHKVEGPLISFLLERYPSGFGAPIDVHVNSQPLPLSDLDVELGEQDIVVILVRPGGTEALWAVAKFIIGLIVSYAVNRLFAPDSPRPPSYADQPEPNTVYSLSVKQNAARIGEPIPVVYGEVMTTPDYASQPYFAYTEAVVETISAPEGTYIYTPALYGSPEVEINKTQLWVYKRDYYYGDPVSDYYLIDGGGPNGEVDPSFYAETEYHSRDANPGGFPPIPEIFPVNRFWVVQDPDDLLWFFDPFTFEMDSFSQLRKDSVLAQQIITRTVGDDGEQYLFYLLSIGNGDHDPINAERIKIGNTFLDTLDTNDINVLDAPASVHGEQLGNVTALFNAAHSGTSLPTYHENVISAIEVGEQELEHLNDTTNWFPTGNLPVTEIAVDILFPRGLFAITTTGSFTSKNVGISIYFRPVLGVGVYGTELEIPVVFNNPGNPTVTAYRRSLRFAVPKAKYQVRIKRTSGQDVPGGREAGLLQWIGLRGYIALDNEGQAISAYGNTHLVAMRIRASDIVSREASSRVQVRARRKLQLPAWLGLGTANQFTQNPTAFLWDVYTNSAYGGRRIENELDQSLMTDLAIRWQGYNGFNGVFNGRSTIFEAMKTVLQPVAAEPMPIGGLVSVRYEGIRSITTQVYTEANIIKDSLSVSYTLRKTGEKDGVLVEYRNRDTWQSEFVMLPVDAVDPERIVLFGCTDQLYASQFAQYLVNRKLLLRKNIRFDTELEGLIPRPGDRIGVQHQIFNMGYGGVVIKYNATTRELTIDNPVDLDLLQTNQIVFRTESGTLSEYINITSQPDENKIILASAPSITLRTGLEDNPTHYAIGLSSEIIEDILVDTVTHRGGNNITIEGTAYKPAVYQNAMPFLLEEI